MFGTLVLGPRQTLRIMAKPRSAVTELRHWVSLTGEEPETEGSTGEVRTSGDDVRLPVIPEVPST